VRYTVFFALILFLAGCGSPAAKSPTPVPTKVSAKSESMTFSAPPPMRINTHAKYTATVITTDGTFTMQLFPRVAPVTVNSFVFLARKGFYNHVKFHRIIAPFMVQTGDPTGTGTGGPGYEIKDELPPKNFQYAPGYVAMANHGPNTNGSQFFIITGLQGLDLNKSRTFTVFGHVLTGMNVVERIAQTPITNDPASNEPSYPLTDVYMKRVIIHGP